ncbi:MAG TPA: DUF2231 domain-containing protein [Gemmatimonadales bacterium]
MWLSAAEWHAALNDLPPALLLASIVFDLLGSATRREALKAAGFWTLVAGAAGALVAMISGLRAEDTIEHGEAVHRVMERHETLAITATVVFGVLALWRIWRRGTLAGIERTLYLGAAAAGVGLVIWVAHLGGTIVFRHGGGVPTAVMQEALTQRTGEHEHAPGEEHDDQPAPAPDTTGADTATGGHTHAPGTPPHEH